MLLRASTAMMLLATAVAAASIFACDDGSDALTSRRGSSASRTGGGGTLADGGVDPSGSAGSPERLLFEKVQPDLLAKCANGCHDTGANGGAPKFLAGPDVYASIKGQNGVVTPDVYSSILLTKGPHMGPAVSSLPDMQTKLIDWLNAEAAVLSTAALPSTPAFTVTSGTNNVDLTPAATGVTGVSLRFDAQLVGGMLQLTNITVKTGAGTDVHVLQPKFVRVKADGSEVEDPADSFSNADQTIAASSEAVLSPGSVFFSALTWRPFDLAADKLKIEVTKLEPGKQSTTQAQATCKDPAGFAANVLPGLRASQTGNGTCGGCHNNGLGGMTLASNDAATVCQQVLQKLDKTDITKSPIIAKVTGGNHSGGQATNANAFRQLFTNNAGVFF